MEIQLLRRARCDGQREIEMPVIVRAAHRFKVVALAVGMNGQLVLALSICIDLRQLNSIPLQANGSPGLRLPEFVQSTASEDYNGRNSFGAGARRRDGSGLPNQLAMSTVRRSVIGRAISEIPQRQQARLAPRKLPVKVGTDLLLTSLAGPESHLGDLPIEFGIVGSLGVSFHDAPPQEIAHGR